MDKLIDYVEINPKINLSKGVSYTFVAMKDLLPNNRFVFSSQKNNYKGSGSKFKTGDTLFARITPCLQNGKTSQFISENHEEGFGSSEFIILREKKGKSLNDYIFYLTRTKEFREYAIQNMIGTSGRQRVPNEIIASFEHSFPSVKVQKNIITILNSFDNKIELNKKTNETIESIAKTLFKSWFIDFDPVRAKEEGRSTGLPDKISDLFPDSFENLESGKVPKGWGWQRLGDLMKLDKGISYKGSFLSDSEGLPMINLGCFIGNGKFRENKMKFYNGDYKERHIGKNGDIFIANTDLTQDRIVLGSPIIMPKWKDHQKFLFSHHVFALRIKKENSIWKEFIYHSLLQSKFRNIAIGFATGTTVLALPKDGILDYVIPKPSEKLVSIFGEFVEELLFKSENNSSQNSTITLLRDEMLPKLISGQLKIDDAEKIIEESGI